jgi:hypothetical protein
MANVTLTHPIIGDREFSKQHAEKLMAMEKNGGWELKETTKESPANDADGSTDSREVKSRGNKSRSTK